MVPDLVMHSPLSRRLDHCDRMIQNEGRLSSRRFVTTDIGSASDGSVVVYEAAQV